MTIATDITKSDLIAAIGKALMAMQRVEEAARFYELAKHARDVQEVMAILPDDLPVEYGAKTDD